MLENRAEAESFRNNALKDLSVLKTKLQFQELSFRIAGDMFRANKLKKAISFIEVTEAIITRILANEKGEET